MRFLRTTTLFLGAAALVILSAACGGGDPAPGGSFNSGYGKAESKTSSCPLNGRFVVHGDFPSFSDWVFAFNDGALIDSYTDDLSSEAWPTTAVIDPLDETNVSLVQITHGSDAIITTVLYLAKQCVNKGEAAVEPVVGQTLFYDMKTNETYVDTHRVLSEAGCDRQVANCRSECAEAMAAGDSYNCFEVCMDTNVVPCPKLCEDRSSRGVHDCRPLVPAGS